MSIERIYQVSKIDEGKKSRPLVAILLSMSILLTIVLCVWYIYLKPQFVKPVSDNVKIPVASTDSLQKSTLNPKKVQAKPEVAETQQPISRNVPKTDLNNNGSEVNKSISTNILIGRVLQQRPNESVTGEPGVSVYYFDNNIKREVFTDAIGNYEIAVPVDTDDAINCKIILYYKKGNLLNTRQTVSCNQKNLDDIKFTSL